MKYITSPSFDIEPGDGTGSSLKDARIRNDKNLCAMTNCGNSLEENHQPMKHGLFLLCGKCLKKKDCEAII